MYGYCECGCCEPARVVTKEEKIELLKGYREVLKEKMEWIDKAVAELSKQEKTGKKGK